MALSQSFPSEKDFVTELSHQEIFAVFRVLIFSSIDLLGPPVQSLAVLVSDSIEATCHISIAVSLPSLERTMDIAFVVSRHEMLGQDRFNQFSLTSLEGSLLDVDEAFQEHALLDAIFDREDRTFCLMEMAAHSRKTDLFLE